MDARFLLLGIGAMRSPRYRPAGLLVNYGRARVMLDGGRGSEPNGPVKAWFVCDARSELQGEIVRLAARHGLVPEVAAFSSGRLQVQPLRVRHTSHPTYGYQITTPLRRVVWAPEFLNFPRWASGADLMFAEAAGWSRPILFARNTGGHASVTSIARAARRAGVKRLVFAHIGRPTIRALDRGDVPAFGEIGVEGQTY